MIAALVILTIAVRECVGLWRGDEDDCCASICFGEPEVDADRCSNVSCAT